MIRGMPEKYIKFKNKNVEKLQVTNVIKIETSPTFSWKCRIKNHLGKLRGPFRGKWPPYIDVCSEILHYYSKTDTFERRTGARFSKVSINNGLWTPLKAAVVYIQDRGFNSFPANTLKITVDKIKCTDSLGRTHAFKVPGGAGGGTDWKEASLPLCYKAPMPSPSEHMKPKMAAR